MRVRVADAALLPDLCDYLSLQGYVAVETSEDEADVLMPTRRRSRSCDEADGEGGDFTPAPEISTLRADVAFWRKCDTHPDPSAWSGLNLTIPPSLGRLCGT